MSEPVTNSAPTLAENQLGVALRDLGHAVGWSRHAGVPAEKLTQIVRATVDAVYAAGHRERAGVDR